MNGNGELSPRVLQGSNPAVSLLAELH
jgi:hypothetical protein